MGPHEIDLAVKILGLGGWAYFVIDPGSRKERNRAVRFTNE